MGVKLGYIWMAHMNGSKLKRYDLHFNKTISYFIEHISCGNTLSSKIVKQIDFNEGKFFIILPTVIDQSKLYDFPNGGIIKPIYHHSKMQTYGVIHTMHWPVSQLLYNLIQSKRNSCLIIEDCICKSSDPNIEIQNAKLLSYGSEVYQYLDQSNSVKDIHLTLRVSEQVWHSFAVLTSKVKSLQPMLTEENLEFFSKQAQTIIAGAYDGEAFIIWEQS